MTTKHLKTLIAALTEKIQVLEKDIRIKEYTINSLQRKLKDFEGRD